MDRLKLIEVIAGVLRDEIVIEDDYLRSVESVAEERAERVGDLAGRIADAIILASPSGLRSLRTPDGSRGDPEGGTMPPGPWSGSA